MGSYAGKWLKGNSLYWFFSYKQVQMIFRPKSGTVDLTQPELLPLIKSDLSFCPQG